MKKRRLRFVYSCSDYVHHEHRYRFTARLCGFSQRPAVRVVAALTLLCIPWAWMIWELFFK